MNEFCMLKFGNTDLTASPKEGWERSVCVCVCFGFSLYFLLKQGLQGNVITSEVEISFHVIWLHSAYVTM